MNPYKIIVLCVILILSCTLHSAAFSCNSTTSTLRKARVLPRGFWNMALAMIRTVRLPKSMSLHKVSVLNDAGAIVEGFISSFFTRYPKLLGNTACEYLTVTKLCASGLFKTSLLQSDQLISKLYLEFEGRFSQVVSCDKSLIKKMDFQESKKHYYMILRVCEWTRLCPSYDIMVPRQECIGFLQITTMAYIQLKVPMMEIPNHLWLSYTNELLMIYKYHINSTFVKPDLKSEQIPLSALEFSSDTTLLTFLSIFFFRFQW